MCHDALLLIYLFAIQLDVCRLWCRRVRAADEITGLMHTARRWPQSACSRMAPHAVPWILVHVFAMMAAAIVLKSTAPPKASDLEDVPHHHHTGTPHANDPPPSLLSTRFMNAVTPVLPPLYSNASAPDATVSGHGYGPVAIVLFITHAIDHFYHSRTKYHLRWNSIVVGCVGVCVTERCMSASHLAMACLSQLTACTSTVQ